jgi:hypothetical protein
MTSRGSAAAVVSAAEGELLAVARALVTTGGYPSVEATLTSAVSLTKIGPSAMSVLESTLARGVVKILARLGGARPRVPPGSGGRPARVFEVRSPPALAFSGYTFELLRWLTVTPLASSNAAAFEAAPRTLGDELAAYLALRLVEGRRLERPMARSPGLRTPLTWLAYARPFSRGATGAGEVAPAAAPAGDDDDRWTVLECLSSDLARRWLLSASWDEHDVVDAGEAVRIGTAERAVVDRFLDRIDAADRWDVATFLVDAAWRALVLHGRVEPAELARRVSPPLRAEDATLRVRSEAKRQAGALFHALARIAKKRDELALVRFIDDGYEAAQAILSEWEALPREAFTRAEQVVRSLAALDATASG